MRGAYCYAFISQDVLCMRRPLWDLLFYRWVDVGDNVHKRFLPYTVSSSSKSWRKWMALKVIKCSFLQCYFFRNLTGVYCFALGVMLTPQISVSLIPRVFLCLSVDMWLLDIVPVDELMPQISAYSLCPKYPCSLCPKYPHIAYVQNILAVASRNRTSIQNIRISSAGNIRMIDA